MDPRSWPAEPQDYKQECTEHANTGVNSKPAWRAKLHRSAQKKKTQERNGARYVLCRSQE
jgi:hypothetical protein